MKAIIGISGLARDGKDSVCKILQKFFEKEVDCFFHRVSLADPLKQECISACLEIFDIDPTQCSPEEKEKIRDYLVFYGKVMRNKTQGTHWTSEAEKTIKQIEKKNKNNIFCIPDIRYAEFEKDEAQWLKEQKNSFLIHIIKYDLVIDPISGTTTKIYSTPVNNQEKINTPIVEKSADFVIEWQNCFPEKPENNQNSVDAVNFVAQKILDTLIETKSLTTNKKLKKTEENQSV